MNATIKIAVAQMVSGEILAVNLKVIHDQIQQAAGLGAALVVFPENCLLMLSSGLLGLAQELQASTSIFDKIAKSAREHNIAVLLGSVPILAEPQVEASRVRAAALLWDATGQLISRYDKIHLFDAQVSDGQGRYCESEFIAPGQELITTQLGGFCFGLSICYDLRFPALFQGLRARGAEVLLVPAAFTHVTGKAHWQVLLRARAIENQCYVLGVNQGGLHRPGRETYGFSMAIDPWGEVMDSLEKGQGLLVVDLCQEKLQSVRASMPVFEHRRPLPG